MEPSVYLLPKINQKAYALLRSAEIDVKYSSERDFNFNHSKYFVIDQTALLGTGNMTKTSLIQNRDFFVIMTSVPEIEYLVTLFERDIEHVPPFKPNNSLVVAPINARVIIHSLINESLKSLTIMSESLSDSQILGLLVAAKDRGVKVIVCLPHDRPL